MASGLGVWVYGYIHLHMTIYGNIHLSMLLEPV